MENKTSKTIHGYLKTEMNSMNITAIWFYGVMF